ncbi:hypothetical protein PBRA_000392 [Plasmodiophora brassicae]|uniref:Uncharacterized protein n=1 Tax=Plasmodiophora brassicae TaxID=37360 RepID=A0A0G4IHQ8_PLABS|nr:hypothetical protein PBRA_000392 [Plasmodiophora brassicae]
MDPVDGGAAQDASRTNVSAARAVFAGLAAVSSAPTPTGKSSPKIVTVDAAPDDDDDNVGSTAARGSGDPITRTPRPAHDASAAFSFTKTPTMKHSTSNDGSSTLSPADTPREKVLSKQSSATSDDAGRDALSTPASSSKSGPAKTLPFGKADPATPSGAGHKVSGTVVGLASSGNDDAPNRDSTTPVADALRPNSVLAKAASFNTDSNRSSTRSNSNNAAPDGGRRGVLAVASSFNRGTTEPSSSTAPSDDTEPANSTSVLKMADPRNRTTTTESATKARVSMSVDVEQVPGSLSAPASSSSDAGSASRLRSALSATGISGAPEDSAATDASSSSRLMKRPSKLVSDLQARINITPAMMLPGSTPRSSKASITTMNDPVPTGTSSDGTQDKPSVSVDQALLARPSIRAQSRRRGTTSKFTTNDQSTLDEVEKQAAMRIEAHGPEQSVQPVVRTVATHSSPGHCALVVAVREAIDTLKEVTATATPEQLSAPAAQAVSKAVQTLEHAIAEHGVVSEVQVGSKQDERVVVLSAATTTSVSEVL